MGFAATNPSKDYIEHAHLVVDVGDATSLYDRIWTEVKGGE
jgi:ligand-binding SRPBCC domain-containing protein